MDCCKRTHFDSLVTGIAGESGFATVTVNKYLMNHQVGFLASPAWNIR